jgi:hypothetical protein
MAAVISPLFKADSVNLAISAVKPDNCASRTRVLERQPWGLGNAPANLPTEGHPRRPGSDCTAVPSIRAAGEAARLHMGTSLALCAAARLG